MRRNGGRRQRRTDLSIVLGRYISLLINALLDMQFLGMNLAKDRMSPPRLSMEEMAMNKGFSREQIDRVARMYKCNGDACRALGITLRSFSRLCRKYDLESPFARRRRQVHEFRDRAIAAD